MIVRVWHCWTTPDNADEYEQLVLGTVIPEIESQGIAGLQAIELHRRDGRVESEFKFQMWFESLDGVKEFAGDDYTKPRISDEAERLLQRYRDRARIYELRARKSY